MSIPNDAVGIYSANNEMPLQYRDTDVERLLFDITIVSDTELIATQRSTESHNANNYLGGIVSGDRSTIIWLNDTKPLP